MSENPIINCISGQHGACPANDRLTDRAEQEEPEYPSVLLRDKRRVMATSLKIDDALKGRVQQLAGQRRRSAHWIMLEAIQQYVEREEAREHFKQEALASWVAYQETGQHLTGQEVRTWLNTWGTEDETTVPVCHT
jgi:predicted transcriptional regulator